MKSAGDLPKQIKDAWAAGGITPQNVIQEMQRLLEVIASMECETTKLAEWQRNMLDILSVNIELLRRIKDEC